VLNLVIEAVSAFRYSGINCAICLPWDKPAWLSCRSLVYILVTICVPSATWTNHEIITRQYQTDCMSNLTFDHICLRYAGCECGIFDTNYWNVQGPCYYQHHAGVFEKRAHTVPFRTWCFVSATLSACSVCVYGSICVYIYIYIYIYNPPYSDVWHRVVIASDSWLIVLSDLDISQNRFDMLQELRQLEHCMLDSGHNLEDFCDVEPQL